MSITLAIPLWVIAACEIINLCIYVNVMNEEDGAGQT